MSSYLNIHVLHPSPMANLNRDDTGAPKSLVYGGVSRARWSSQSLKRAARVAFEAANVGDRTIRSKSNSALVVEKAVALLEAAGESVDEDLRAALTKKANSKTNALVAKDAAKADTLVWLAERELDDIAAGIAGVGDEATVSSATSSLSIAAFGRMFANAPAQQTEAAIQVAHAFTVNAANMDVDYFTAVDDLGALSGHAGAGHLEVAPYTSGVYYRYLNVDRNQLLRNWDVDPTDPHTTERLAALVRTLVLSLPTGKLNSTAAHTPPAHVVFHVSGTPASLAPAFEATVPATQDGYLAGAIGQFDTYWAALEQMYPGLLGEKLVASLRAPGAAPLGDLIDAATSWMLTGAPLTPPAEAAAR